MGLGWFAGQVYARLMHVWSVLVIAASCSALVKNDTIRMGARSQTRRAVLGNSGLHKGTTVQVGGVAGAAL